MSQELPQCKNPDEHRWCDSGSCGTNSPWLNPFPWNGLRHDGACNEEGVQLIPGSLRGGKAGRCDGHTLDIVRNGLVGRSHEGVIHCQGDEVIGASFEIRAWTNQTLRIRIAAMEAYSPPPPPSGATPHVDTRMAYQLVVDGAAAPGGGDPAASLCSATGSKAVRDQLGLKSVADLPPAVAHDLVIPIEGELYGPTGIPIVDPDGHAPDRAWLQLACVDTALAKRSLYRLNTDNVDRSRAALKMLTASYCGRRAWTHSGLEIGWDDGQPDELEARWGVHQAKCLSRPRLLAQSADPAHDLQSLPPELRNLCDGKPCPTATDWIQEIRTCTHEGASPAHGLELHPGEDWPSYFARLAAGPAALAPPTPLAACNTCQGAGCNALLESFIRVMK